MNLEVAQEALILSRAFERLSTNSVMEIKLSWIHWPKETSPSVPEWVPHGSQPAKMLANLKREPALRPVEIATVHEWPVHGRTGTLELLRPGFSAECNEHTERRRLASDAGKYLSRIQPDHPLVELVESPSVRWWLWVIEILKPDAFTWDVPYLDLILDVNGRETTQLRTRPGVRLGITRDEAEFVLPDATVSNEWPPYHVCCQLDDLLRCSATVLARPIPHDERLATSASRAPNWHRGEPWLLNKLAGLPARPRWSGSASAIVDAILHDIKSSNVEFKQADKPSTSNAARSLDAFLRSHSDRLAGVQLSARMFQVYEHRYR